MKAGLLVEEKQNLITYVESDKEKFLFHYGEAFLWESLPVGTRVIYPPPPLPEVEDVEGAIDRALEEPVGCDPLSAQIRAGMRVTIAFDDLSLPLPPMQTPDLRQLIIEKVLEKLTAKGVDDVHLIAATGLHRRMTADELRRVLGERIFKSFYSHRLYNHDAEDKNKVVLLGKTEAKEEVELNRRAAESDMLIYVNINLSGMDGGHKSLTTGLTTYRTIRYHHNTHTLMNCRSYMDPTNSALHDSCGRMGRLVNQHIKCFHIETVLNSDTFPHFFGFLQKKECQFSAWDKVNFHCNHLSLQVLPYEIRRRIFQSMVAPYRMIGIFAGQVDIVHERTLQTLYRQQSVPVRGQSDVVIAGVPYLCPYNVNSIMNPILVACLTLGYCFNMYRGKPLLRPGGVLIYTHPVDYRFHPIHHPSYIDFFERVLPDTTEPKEVEKRYEADFAYNSRYIALYRDSYAYHGVHPFYMWYWGCYAMKYASKIIFVKPKSRVAVQRMGFETADSITEALAKAQEVVGENPSITYYHWPPIFICDVE